MDEMRRKQLELKDAQRKQKIKTELYTQTDNFELYKWNKERKQEKINKQKALVANQVEQKHQALVQKISLEKDNLDYFRDRQKMTLMLKAEMRKLKESDLFDLQTQQKRIKHQ